MSWKVQTRAIKKIQGYPIESNCYNTYDTYALKLTVKTIFIK